jgi:hypothetical protein
MTKGFDVVKRNSTKSVQVVAPDQTVVLQGSTTESGVPSLGRLKIAAHLDTSIDSAVQLKPVSSCILTAFISALFYVELCRVFVCSQCAVKADSTPT